MTRTTLCWQQWMPRATRRQSQMVLLRSGSPITAGVASERSWPGDPATGDLLHLSSSDEFATADHFNTPPFRNINFSQIEWVCDEHGLKRELPRQSRALRQAFNSMCQSTGADHLRWLMNRFDAEI